MATVDHPIRSVGIIGAGTMGCGIAELSARAGMRVLIFDSNATAAGDAVTAIRATASVPCRILTVTSDTEFAMMDLIIEAVPEDMALKSSIFQRIEPHLNERTIIASNTSSLPMTRLAEVLTRPERFCGLHFCHPVSCRALVEVVRCGQTSSSTVERVCRYATNIGKWPLVVPDSPGFLLNRLLVPYMNETLELLLHGASIDSLDRAARSFGMPIRPLALFDEFGFDVALAVGRSLYSAYPERIAPSELLIAMYKSGRRGRKSAGGFYRTSIDAEFGRIDPDVLDLIHERRRTTETLSDEVVSQRLFLPMLLEATRILEESLLDSPRTIDAALRGGLGLTHGSPGLFSWANSIGARTIIKWLQPFRSLGQRFEPTQLLLDAAARNAPIAERQSLSA